jgi:hypothetical protein
MSSHRGRGCLREFTSSTRRAYARQSAGHLNHCSCSPMSRLVDDSGRCTSTPSSAATGSEHRRRARRSWQPIAVHAHVQQAIKYMKKTNSTQINSQQGEKLKPTVKAFCWANVPHIEVCWQPNISSRSLIHING